MPHCDLIRIKLVISDKAEVHESVSIGNNVTIHDGAVIHAHVSIYNNVEIGKNSIIHANTVLGSHAFYYKKKETGYDPLVTCGRLVIEDNVDIGANLPLIKELQRVQ